MAIPNRLVRLADLAVSLTLLTTWFTQEVGRIPPVHDGAALVVAPALLVALSVALSGGPPAAVVGTQLLSAIGILLSPERPAAWMLVMGIAYAAMRVAGSPGIVARRHTLTLVLTAIVLLAGNALLLGLRAGAVHPLENAIASVLTVVGSAAVGALWRLWRERRPLIAQRQELETELLETEREFRVVSEKSDLARDVHDVMAHSLAVVLVQADGARSIVHSDPERAARALTEISETTRASLIELRLLLESFDAERRIDAFPGLDDLDDLIDRFRRAGTDIEVGVTGDAQAAPERIQLVAYRIVQESLTNALRHSGPRPNARVHIMREDERLIVEITSSGFAAGAASDGSGHGLAGMRERAAQAGGSLTAEATTEGFRVRAILPLRSATPEGDQ